MKSFSWLLLFFFSLEMAFAQELSPPAKSFDAGIRVGEKTPAFRLKNQSGKEFDFNAIKGPKGAAILFFRSADWCPYCKTALVQLQGALSKYKAQGLGVAAISYDSVEVLETFGKRANITYPMLSDSDSAVIRAFGILNTQVPQNSPQYGIPYPGTFIVDPGGKIVAKYFEEDFRERFTPDTIITKQVGSGGGHQVEVKTEHLTLSTSISQEKARPGNRITLVAEVKLPPKMHIYAPGVEGYRPAVLAIEASPDLTAHAPRFPESKIMLLPAIKERVPVYEGKVRIMRDFTISQNTKPPTVEVRGRFEYQACDDKICYLPKTVPLAFTIDIESFDRERVPEALRRRAPSSQD
ncbi:MAG: redoxin domain-containing protein [Acidobacteria bacterium]|nr:redoxin domain-containing protein [Acidobacteriota bacterium]